MRLDLKKVGTHTHTHTSYQRIGIKYVKKGQTDFLRLTKVQTVIAIGGGGGAGGYQIRRFAKTTKN